MAKRKASGRTAKTPAATSAPADLPEANPKKKPFTPEVMDRTVVAIPLLNKLMAERKAHEDEPGYKLKKPYHVIIDLHLTYPGGRSKAREQAKKLIAQVLKGRTGQWIKEKKSALSQQYLFGKLDGDAIEALARLARPKGPNKPGPIYRIWEDFPVRALLIRSVSTVKADAALNSFGTTGEGIVWAVMDSGIDATHPHFVAHDNLNLNDLPSVRHGDFTAIDDVNLDDKRALIDKYGHGTHVAGIIAGEIRDGTQIDAETNFRNEKGDVIHMTVHPRSISGVAPRCKLVSLKVLDDEGKGQASNLIAAIEAIQEINGHGRYLRIHGVNMSVGYDFEPEWFACGQSPLCVEVDRLVKSGVVVVVAAGNTGYGFSESAFKGTVAAGLGLTINDPGNAELAVTVGSTHREMPHVYGVSYFSSKGPTGDGRPKPDLVAPGEKVISCASGWRSPDEPGAAAANRAMEGELEKKLVKWGAKGRARDNEGKKARSRNNKAKYKEDSGTSMAAPHVSGAIAAFLSVRKEFIGRPERVKEIFVSTATDLKRDRSFQGHGLLDLMRAIQSV
ncbi:MAG TPA: S8 family peptidase [Methyloceanibacter sp.]|jgi:subtilisin family serine protease|nr:S8 family peptidase [Methyloceanibacter sp.]